MTIKRKVQEVFLVSGSRDFPDEKLVEKVCRHYFRDKSIVYIGDARGVDTWAYTVAVEVCKNYPKVYKADWERLGKSAGIVRNRHMIIEMLKEHRPLKGTVRDNVRALIFWDGHSHGTEMVLNMCQEFGIPITLVKADYD